MIQGRATGQRLSLRCSDANTPDSAGLVRYASAYQQRQRSGDLHWNGGFALYRVTP